MSIVHDLLNLCESLNSVNLSELSKIEKELESKFKKISEFITSELVGIIKNRPTKFKYELPRDREELINSGVFPDIKKGRIGGSRSNSYNDIYDGGYKTSYTYEIDTLPNSDKDEYRDSYIRFIINKDKGDLSIQLSGYDDSKDYIVKSSNPKVSDLDNMLDELFNKVIKSFSNKEYLNEYLDLYLANPSEIHKKANAKYSISFRLLTQVFTNLVSSKVYK